MEKHKSKALEEGCLCYKCVFRFQCFTQERIFSDPIFQGLFEALMAQGKSKEEALDEVIAEIKFKMNRPVEIGGGSDGSDAVPYIPYPYPTTPDIQPYIQPWTVISDYYGMSDNVTFDVNDKGEVYVSYTMHDGKEVNWLCK